MKYTLVIMNLFYTPDIKGDYYILSPEESKHCLRVLRMGAGDSLVLVIRWCWWMGKAVGMRG